MAAISGANIVTDGLIFYIDPTNTNTYSGVGTTAYNLIPGGINNFSLNNGLSYDLDKSGSFYFDGSNDYVGLGSTTIFNSTTFTVSFWIKPTTYSGTYCSGAVSNGQYTLFGTTSSYQGYSSTFSGAIQFGSSNNCIATVNQSNFSINKWYHYVAVYDSAGTGNSTKFKIYIDGVIKSLTFDATMPSSPYAAGQEARIGWGPGGGAYPYYNGNIGLVQIHSRALSSTEILQNYNATKARFDTTENIVTNGLILNVDPGKSASYPGTGTTINDLSGSGLTGTLVSSPTFSTLNGGSLVFNGSSYITRSSALNTGQNFSVTAWIYPTSLGARNAIVGNGYPYTTDNGWLFCICDNNFSLFQALFLSIGQNNVLKISNSYVFQLNKWSHVSCSVSGGGSSVKFYVNGVETSYGFTIESGRTISYSNNEFHIGMRHSTTGERFAGNISQVQIYNTTLTATEIQQNYNATKYRYINVLPPVNDSLILNLDAGNRASYAGTGTTWYDLSGNNLNGTLINGPTYSGTGTSTIITTDGTDDYIEVLDNSLLDFGANNFTVEYWFKKLSTTTGYDNIWGVNKWNVGGGGAGTNEWALEIGQGSTGTGDFVAFAVESGSTTYATSYFNLTNALTQYHQLVGIRSGNKLELYLDGSQLYSNTPAGFTTSVSVNNISGRNLRIANAALNNLYTNTSSAVVRLYSKALSSTEILQNFNFYRSRYGI
jgi:hypothetical protein